ncbi:hypothetical protein B9Z55_011163 [Caenorhabditis nigoni]|uniref:AAA+ ATPase domain-containing protein n=2 Tax=Caenorhabditis nigoni TaxID=1611254 RepID=A0A2G5UIU8_9PELO|nr:hypothetical protein B9Z55_011163 [Caenorhabditis nigoni]
MPMSSTTAISPGFRLRFPSQTTIIGATQSGKTTLLRKILENDSFDAPIDNIFWFYGVDTPSIPRHLSKLRAIEGLPDVDLLRQHKDQNNVLVCDDLMNFFARDKKSLHLLNDLFCLYAHHMNCAIFNLVQSAFALPPITRNNSTYLILMRNLSDAAQIKNLLVQQFGQKWRGAYEAYEEIMAKPYQSMLINNDPMANPAMRILSNFTEPYPMAHVPI